MGDFQPQDVVALERKLCRQEPYLSMGRYIHVWAKRTGMIMGEILANTAAEQPIDELVGWVKQHDFSLNLTTERLAFLIAIACVK